MNHIDNKRIRFMESDFTGRNKDYDDSQRYNEGVYAEMLMISYRCNMYKPVNIKSIIAKKENRMGRLKKGLSMRFLFGLERNLSLTGCIAKNTSFEMILELEIPII